MVEQWEFEEEGTSDGKAFSVYDEHGGRLTIPFITEPRARLIAAAPDLLAVAEKLKEWSRKYPSSRVFSHYEIVRIAAEIDAINAECCAAIAKATASEGAV